MKKHLHFYYWKSKGGDWRWHLRAGNGRILAEGEGYRRRCDALKAIDLIRASASAPLVQGEELP